MAPRVYSEKSDRIVTRNPVVVQRYTVLTRINHWILAVTFIALMLSGLALFSPSLFGLSVLFGGGQMMRWLHPFIGIAMAVSFLGMFVQLVSYNILARADIVWAEHIGDVVSGHEERLPELGKYNLGQKLVFWGMFWGILGMLATGIVIWQEYFNGLVAMDVRRWAMVAHAVIAVLMILLFVVHVYAAWWTRGTIRAMTRGTVTGGWAWRHHRKWLRELAGRQVNDRAN